MADLDDPNYIPVSGAEEDERDAVVDAPRSRQHRGRTVFKNKQGEPIRFFFYSGVEGSSKRSLTKRIEDNGGKVVTTEDEADIVLVGPQYSDQALEGLRAAYRHSDDPARWARWVEKTSFVKSSIEDGKVRHKRKRQTKQGFVGKRGRVDYTEEDERELCKFLWKATCANGGRGRTAINLYTSMVAMADHANEHKWAARHTPESWRNRYKKNQARLDEEIESIAAAMSEEIRQHFKASGRHGPVTENDGDDEDEDEQQEEDFSNEINIVSESEEERPPRRKRATGNKRPQGQRLARRANAAAASPPRASGSRSQRNTRREEPRQEPESEDEEPVVQKEHEQENAEEEEEAEQIQDSLFDGPYDDLTFAAEHTQTTLVNASAEQRGDKSGREARPTSQRAQEKGKQVQRPPASQQIPQAQPTVPAREIRPMPRMAARRPRTPVPSSPPPEEQVEIPQVSPVRQPSTSVPSRTQQQPPRPSIAPSIGPSPSNTSRRLIRTSVPIAVRRPNLPPPILPKPTQPQASSSTPRTQPRESVARTQAQVVQSIYPVISPSHHIAAAMSTPVRRHRGSDSSFDSESSNFPYPGTKADSMNRLLMEEHKRTPYTAAPGTRAAAYLSPEMRSM